MKSDSCTFLKKDHLGYVQLAVMAYVYDLVIASTAQMVKEFIAMIQEEFILKHVNFLTSERPVELLGRTIKHLKMGTSRWRFLRSSLMSCSKSLRSMAMSQLQDSNFRLFQKIRRFSVTRSFIKSSEQQVANSEMTSSTPSRSFRDHSSTLRTKSPRVSFTCSSLSIRLETLSLSQNLSVQSGINKASFQFSLSVLRFRLGRLSKVKEVNGWFIGFSIQCQSSVS